MSNSTVPGENRGSKSKYLNGGGSQLSDLPPIEADEGGWSREELIRMDAAFCAAMSRAITQGLELRRPAGNQSRSGANGRSGLAVRRDGELLQQVKPQQSGKGRPKGTQAPNGRGPASALTRAEIIRAEIIGSSRACVPGVSVRGRAPVLTLCRRLIALGCDPRAPLEAYRGAVLCLKISSLAYGAGLTVKYGHREGKPRFKKTTAPEERPWQSARLPGRLLSGAAAAARLSV
jgi:hypothetical protein